MNEYGNLTLETGIKKRIRTIVDYAKLIGQFSNNTELMEKVIEESETFATLEKRAIESGIEVPGR